MQVSLQVLYIMLIKEEILSLLILINQQIRLTLHISLLHQINLRTLISQQAKRQKSLQTYQVKQVRQLM